jgi:GntR family transcriptional regulator, histidine utilization repressor
MAGTAKRARKREYELPRGVDALRPLGERIKEFVVGKIESGAWPEGHHVPSETELAKGFGTARMTVHSALRALAAEGILLRRPGAGTHVASRKPRAPLMEVRNIVDEIRERGHRHSASVELLAAEPCDLAIATELEVPAGSLVYHSLIVHFEGERPLQLENRYVLPSFAGDYLKQDYTRRTPHEYLMSLGPLEEVEHMVQALTPDRQMRALLEIPATEPVLHVRRRTWSAGIVVSTARLAHPGSRYSLFGRFQVAGKAPP